MLYNNYNRCLKPTYLVFPFCFFRLVAINMSPAAEATANYISHLES